MADIEYCKLFLSRIGFQFVIAQPRSVDLSAAGNLHYGKQFTKN